MEKININKAEISDLVKITNIGKKRAEAIVKHRLENRFKDIFELSKLAGLGSARMNQIIKQGIATV